MYPGASGTARQWEEQKVWRIVGPGPSLTQAAGESVHLQLLGSSRLRLRVTGRGAFPDVSELRVLSSHSVNPREEEAVSLPQTLPFSSIPFTEGDLSGTLLSVSIIHCHWAESTQLCCLQCFRGQSHGQVGLMGKTWWAPAFKDPVDPGKIPHKNFGGFPVSSHCGHTRVGLGWTLWKKLVIPVNLCEICWHYINTC
ncbi:hypothetical protein XELAEV_18026170mg [Xenopus laevis]|uniref:Uncharacterized protein n=1 Tax=Xenopus laevis TaxID=8355 RepID=A0A974CTV4_XENLA|nr:hypothetical protein XELAEV_18026170mg [Xenopus laevis]